MRRFFMCALSLFLALGVGCAARHPMTPEEIAAERVRQLEMESRFYPDKTPEEVLLASARLFNLADDDYSVFHAPDSIQAKRSWFHLFSLAVTSGEDDWTVTATAENGGTKVTVRCISETKQARTGPRLMTDEKLYSLFYGRLSYLLGLSHEWKTCTEATKGVWDGSLYPLCQLATDRTPDGRSAGERRETKK